MVAILAAIVVPQLTSAAEEARLSSLKMNLWRFRNQLEVYHEQHGAYPTLANFAYQLTLVSNANGATAAVGTPEYPLGPYFTRISVNPFASTNTVSNGVIGASAWY